MHYRVIETRLVGKQEGKQSRERKTTLANVEISKNEYCEEHLSEFFSSTRFDCLYLTMILRDEHVCKW
jgi:hypothetical protein